MESNIEAAYIYNGFCTHEIHVQLICLTQILGNSIILLDARLTSVGDSKLNITYLSVTNIIGE